MADQNKTLEEELAEQGIVANYIWKPNRLFAKSGSEYISVDVVSDGNAEDILEDLRAAGEQKKAEIESVGNRQISELTQSETDYTNVKANLIQTYTRMKDYFDRHGIVSLSTMMATAIANLNAL